VERVIGAVIITPSIHVIHHSMQYRESNRNFGTLFTVWDKIFATYQAPNHEKAAGPVAVKGLTDESHQTLKALLIQPSKRARLKQLPN
jgi:sterol desaturase/sphingolipid hydroxylase (fatty acid hydroxylase superfamily)